MLTIHTHGVRAQVQCRSAAFAGSCRGTVSPFIADRLVSSLSSLGFSFLVGCAPGIDSCFRDAPARHGSANAIVACAFKQRQGRFGSSGVCALTFSESVTGALALHRFAQMIEGQYGKQVTIQLSDELLPFRSEVVQDILSGLGITEREKSPAIS